MLTIINFVIDYISLVLRFHFDSYIHAVILCIYYVIYINYFSIKHLVAIYNKTEVCTIVCVKKNSMWYRTIYGTPVHRETVSNYTIIIIL